MKKSNDRELKHGNRNKIWRYFFSTLINTIYTLPLCKAKCQTKILATVYISKMVYSKTWPWNKAATSCMQGRPQEIMKKNDNLVGYLKLLVYTLDIQVVRVWIHKSQVFLEYVALIVRYSPCCNDVQHQIRNVLPCLDLKSVRTVNKDKISKIIKGKIPNVCFICKSDVIKKTYLDKYSKWYSRNYGAFKSKHSNAYNLYMYNELMLWI
jgi:hypothetical protein